MTLSEYMKFYDKRAIDIARDIGKPLTNVCRWRDAGLEVTHKGKKIIQIGTWKIRYDSGDSK